MAEKPRLQFERPLFSIHPGRMAYPHHLVGDTLFLLLLRCGKLRGACGDVVSSFRHFRLLCRSKMETALFPFHSILRALLHGNFRHTRRYGRYHGRHVHDNHYRQKLESNHRGRLYIYLRLLLFLLYQYRERQPIHPQDAFLFPPVQRRIVPVACREPDADERTDGKKTFRIRNRAVQSRQLPVERADALPARLVVNQRMGGNRHCGADNLSFDTRHPLCLVLMDTHVQGTRQESPRTDSGVALHGRRILYSHLCQRYHAISQPTACLYRVRALFCRPAYRQANQRRKRTIHTQQRN